MSSLELFKSRNVDMGVIWIFATLGRQSRVRNLSKKTIAQVNIREACHAIAQPEQPVPLRISSQFMAGLARVYVSQAEVWMSDVTAVHTNVRRMALATLAESDTIDLPRTSRTVRKETITFKLPRLPEALFEFDRAADVPIESAWPSPERRVRTEPKHIVSQDKITLPPRVSLVPDDQSLESLLFASELGSGLLDWNPNEGQSGLDLGLFSEHDAATGVFGETAAGGLVGPDLSGNGSLPAEFWAAEWTTSRDDGMPSLAAGPGAADDMPDLEDMPGLDSASHLRPGGKPPGSEILEISDPAWEDPFPKRNLKRRKVTPTSSGALIDFTIEVPEQTLFRNHASYALLMDRLAHQARVKAADKEAAIMAGLYIDGHFDFLADSEALGPFWTDLVQQAKLYCDEKIASHPRGTKRNRALEEGNETRQAQGQVRGFEPGANDELLPMDDMPPLEDMPDTPIGRQNRSTDLIPLEKGPQVLGWEASIISTSDVGVARDFRPAVGLFEAQLPWNTPQMFERIGSDVPRSLSGTPSRGKTTQHMPWIGSLSQPSPLPLAQPGTAGDISEWDLQNAGISNPDDSNASAGDTPAQIAHRTAVEEDNFARYVLAIARSLTAPPGPAAESKCRALFFSDVAPVAEATPAVAAQAFYHVLSLVTANKMMVRQHEPYSEFILTIPDPNMASPAPNGQGVQSGRRNSLISQRGRGTGSRARSGTSGSGGRETQSRENSLSAYLLVASPGTAT